MFLHFGMFIFRPSALSVVYLYFYVHLIFILLITTVLIILTTWGVHLTYLAHNRLFINISVRFCEVLLLSLYYSLSSLFLCFLLRKKYNIYRFYFLCFNRPVIHRINIPSLHPKLFPILVISSFYSFVLFPSSCTFLFSSIDFDY